jgi:hypothetical protein
MKRMYEAEIAALKDTIAILERVIFVINLEIEKYIPCCD